MQTQSKATPIATLLQGCKYTPAAATDITQTWRRFGWVPKAEQEAQAKTVLTVAKAKGARHAAD